jgi:predicted phosphodiesterase
VPSTDPGLRVAFLGDQGIGASAVAVLQLIKREHADLVIHAGDLAYTADVAGWNAQIDAVLGADFPYFAAIGNHDVSSWTGPTGFQAVLDVRLDRIAGAACSGDLGVNSVCRYRGLVFVLSGVGTYGQGHEAFLDAALNDPAVWRLCVWHKNQHDMQVGTKPDEVGWLAYQTCQAHGSPIITGHEHSYARTYTLGALGDAVAQYGYGGAPDQLVFAPGSTAVFQTGLGGQSYRVWNGELAPWWATIYAANKQQLNAVTVGTAPQIAFGALFIDFHVDGDPYKAHGYFKTTNDDVVDDFTMRVTP